MRISKKSFAFYSLPKQKGRGDYEQARQWILNYISGFRDVLSVYEYGTVSAPGISDLDLIVVLKNEPQEKAIGSQLTMEKIPEEYVSDFLGGNIFRFMNERHFRNIRILGDIKVKKLYGETIEFSDFLLENEHLLNICSMMDWLPERVLVLMDLENQQRLSVIEVLGYLYSFLHSVEMVNAVLGEELEVSKNFSDRLLILRKNWFNTDIALNIEELTSLLYEGISLGFELMKIMSDCLVANNYYTPTECKQRAFFYINRRKGFYFVQDSKKVSFEYSKSLFTGEKIWVATPQVWLTHLLHYNTSIGLISSMISNNLKINETLQGGDINLELKDILTKRMELCNDMTSFLKANGFRKGLYRFDHLEMV